MEKRLTRVENGKMLCGVCAGIGQYFNIDPTLIRLGFVILACIGGSGILAYIWPRPSSSPRRTNAKMRQGLSGNGKALIVYISAVINTIKFSGRAILLLC